MRVESFRGAFERSGDDVDAVAARLGWSTRRLHEVLYKQTWVTGPVAEQLCDALHVAPVEVDL